MNWPSELTGSSPLVPWLNSLLRAAKSCEIKTGIGYKVRTKSSTGTILGIEINGVAQSSSVGSNFRGVWTSGTTYANGDMVVVQSGVSAGTYVSTIDANVNDPATGTGWMQIAPGQTVGKWT